MADRYLLESGAPDGYLLEDGSGVLLLDVAATVLVVQDATHSHSADNIVLVQHQVLAVAEARHTHTADNVALVQHQVLAVADATHSHSADNLTLVTEDPAGGDYTEDAYVTRLRERDRGLYRKHWKGPHRP